jgi:hypothetical protein
MEALQSSPSYRETAHELAKSALLAGSASVEISVRRRWSGHRPDEERRCVEFTRSEFPA